ncbi:MAG: hypothetical protein E6Q97_14345 [Desulfurellales bacterium]|nr:MAG: hypothetical protein E6Q97_14345 [Desulfurellales bacterium]
MADITITYPANIRALTEQGAVVLPGTAGSTTGVGKAVALASDGEWDNADGNVTAALARVQGVVVASYDGETTITAGNPLSVCVFGPVSGIGGLTAGANYYLSDTAGAIADAVGTYDRILGWGAKLASEVCLFVSPQQNDPSSA